MDKGPFSIYDFLGYALPGAFAIFILQQYDFIAIDDILKTTFDKSKEINTLYIVSLVVISYVVGHLINFLSSLTVENLAIWLYGYPSSFLLEKPKKNRYLNANYMSGAKYRLDYFIVLHEKTNALMTVVAIYRKKFDFFLLTIKYIIRVLLWMFLLPISIMSWFFGGFLRTIDLILKPMGRAYWDTLKVQWKRYLQMTGFNHLDEDRPDKYYRIITNFVYETSAVHAKKMDNYVALYGFLRSMSLIVSSACLILISQYVFTLFSGDSNEALSFSSVLLKKEVFVIFTLLVVAYLFFIAFLKFYRRYTLEAFSGFMTSNILLKYK